MVRKRRILLLVSTRGQDRQQFLSGSNDGQPGGAGIEGDHQEVAGGRCCQQAARPVVPAMASRDRPGSWNSAHLTGHRLGWCAWRGLRVASCRPEAATQRQMQVDPLHQTL